MKVYDNGIYSLYNGDTRDVLPTLPSESVNCVVTSPPYFGLRDYGTAEWEGGDVECQHNPQKPDGGDRGDRTLPLGRGGLYKDICGNCGATRVDSQVGLEPSPDEYIAALVEVFREIKRVLRKDGVVFLNLGDSYNGYPANVTRGGKLSGRNQHARHYKESGYGLAVKNLKPKDLIGIPWMAAFALRAEGFYLRADIIWHKPNPMPESVKDRPTKAHEYIFLLSKSEKYYYNADAIKEPVAESTIGRGKVDFGGAKGRNYQPVKGDPNFRNGSEQWGRTFDYKESCKNGRNKRSVWTVATKPYKGAHFATFPPALIRPCILAGCPPDGVVLDPFAGSGTTLQVAMESGCRSIGIELNPEYCELIQQRMSQISLFAPR
jgi:DNA modification methylase